MAKLIPASMNTFEPRTPEAESAALWFLCSHDLAICALGACPARGGKISVASGTNRERGGLRSVVSHKSNFGNQEIRQLEL